MMKTYMVRSLLTDLEAIQTRIDKIRLQEQNQRDLPGSLEALAVLESAADHVHQARWELEELLKSRMITRH